MSRSIFGWSYPPGCSGPPDEPDGPCEVCGGNEDTCVCPECPVCGDYGNKSCYESGGKHFHGLLRTKAQLMGKAKLDMLELGARVAEHGQYIEWLSEQPDDYKEKW